MPIERQIRPTLCVDFNSKFQQNPSRSGDQTSGQTTSKSCVCIMYKSCGTPNKYDFVIIHQSFACKSHTLYLLLCVSVGLTYNSGNDPIILRGLCDQAGLPTCTMTPCRSAVPTPPHPAIVHHIPEHAVLTRGEVQPASQHCVVTMCSDGKPNRITADGCLGHMDWFPGPLRKFPSSSIK